MNAITREEIKSNKKIDSKTGWLLSEYEETHSVVAYLNNFEQFQVDIISKSSIFSWEDGKQLEEE